jgi:hypothetical protein
MGVLAVFRFRPVARRSRPDRLECFRRKRGPMARLGGAQLKGAGRVAPSASEPLGATAANSSGRGDECRRNVSWR